MEELNACAQCGFETQNLADFTAHVDRHESEHLRLQQQQQAHSQLQDWPTEDMLMESGHMTSGEMTPVQMTSVTSSNKSSKSTTRPSRAQTNKVLHSCPHCNFTTYMSQHMKSHLEAHSRHEGQMYQCDICQMQFSQKANMHRHRMRHSGVKPYPCRYCQKRFFRKDQMQEHSMTHIKTGADFDCPVSLCQMQFSQHSALRTHLDDYHAIASDSPANCKRCSLLFSNARRLLLHYQTKHDNHLYERATGEQNGSQAPSPSPTSSSSRSSTRKKQHNDSPSMVHVLVGIDPQSPFQLQTANSTAALPVISNDSQGLDHIDVVHNAIMANHDLKLENDSPSFWPEDSTMETGGAAEELASNSPSLDGASSSAADAPDSKSRKQCLDCGLVFLDQTLYFLHKGLHSESDPWKCNLCGQECDDKYRFHTHIISADHS